MPKYYVSSGNFHLIVEADHPRAAAIWAVHRCLSAVTPFVSECDDDHAGDDAGDNAGVGERDHYAELSYQSAEPRRQLGDTVRISEQGFGGADSLEMASLPVIAEWSRLLVALDRLQRRLQSNPAAA